MGVKNAARGSPAPTRFLPGREDDPPPIAAHGLIGDGSSCALVRLDGSIDWLCLPHFDSPSLFGALVDSERGGTTSIHPQHRPFESSQHYERDTNVLETLFHVPGQGQIRLTDSMPWSSDPRAPLHEVHRRVEAREGNVEMEATFDPRFGYGADITRLAANENGVLASGENGERLTAVLGCDARWEKRPAGGVRARFRLRKGEHCWMVISWNTARPEPIGAHRPSEHLRETRNFWRGWSQRIRYTGPWRDAVLRSALVVKLLTDRRTGGTVAAPTTSLPEQLGGVLNWDYRFVWTRDTALVVRAANLIGCTEEARESFHFIREALARSGGLRGMYAVDGSPVPDEKILYHLTGYRGSVPVRIGNAARDQIQLDTAGALVEAAFLYQSSGNALGLRAWRHLCEVLESVRNSWSAPDHGIWETRGQVRHNVHSKLMSWLALERGRRLAPLFAAEAEATVWQRTAAQVRQDLLARGLDPSGRYFVSAYGSSAPDATLLLLPIHGFLPAEDPRVARALDRLRDELGDGHFLRRYPPREETGGREGAFVLCGFWLAEVLALAGHLEQAQEVFEAHIEAANHLGLLAEEVDPDSRELLGNFPQTFSHLGLIQAAARIELGLRLREEGSEKRPHFALD